MIDVTIDSQVKSLDIWRQCYASPVRIQLSKGCIDDIQRSCDAVKNILSSGTAVYGINTGFGSLSNQRVQSEDLCRLQKNLILGHTVGTGPPLSTEVVRLAMVLKIASFAKGFSGVRLELVDRLRLFLEHEVYPVVPQSGSVGASGDLAPLAHLSAALIGEGDIEQRGKVLSARHIHELLGIDPLELQAKEGLALINGTQISTALALAALFKTEVAFATAVVIGAISTEALLGLEEAFDPRIHALRQQRGQIEIAQALKYLITGSKFRQHSFTTGRRQDPYCIRCQPQVLGACRDTILQVAKVLQLEADAVTDNPLIIPGTGEVLSGGNFHAEPIALAADQLAIAICEIGSISERRLAMMTDPALSGLPPFLTSEPGLNSGFMSAQISCAALVAENRQRSHPASVDNVPTVANLEDFVSMATHGARRLLIMVETLYDILAFELLAAVEGCDHRGFELNPQLETVRAAVRRRVPRMNLDRYFAPAIKVAQELVRLGEIAKAAGSRFSLGDD